MIHRRAHLLKWMRLHRGRGVSVSLPVIPMAPSLRIMQTLGVGGLP